MKTALQELIDIIEKKRDSSGFNRKSLKHIHTEALMLLQIEEEQIKLSFVAGYHCRSMEDMIGGSGDEENKYYKETYKK